MTNKYSSWTDLPFWLFTIGIMLLLTLPTLIQDGMFLDGILYTSVSHNLSEGIGTFWFPVASPSYELAGSVYFHEHPPLVFGIQSMFFKVLGDSMYVERFYIFLTMCITALLIKLFWDSIFKNGEDNRKISWLPVFFWITIPACFWSYTNNMMENTMGIFALLSVILIYRSVGSEKDQLRSLLLPGFFIFLATMSKGVPGFFPLGVPFLYWAVYRKKPFLRVVLQTLVILCVPVILYFILFHMNASHESLKFYVTKRLFARVNDDPTVTYRLYIIKRLFTELIPQIILALIIILVSKSRKTNIPLTGDHKKILFFFLTGLSAAAPLALTMVQRGFYLVPSFPYFGLGFAILVSPAILAFRNKIIADHKKLRIYSISAVAVLLFAIGFSATRIGEISRAKEAIHDVHVIGKLVPAGTEIEVNQESADPFIECFFIRYYNISLFNEVPKDYLMLKKSSTAIPGFTKLNADTQVFDLYRKTE